MANDRIAALRRVRQDVVDYCRDLSDGQWSTPSRAAGWRVRDVVAHLGASCRAVASIGAISDLRSDDIVSDNNAGVDRRRDWPTERVLAEFERWSPVFISILAVAGAGPLGRVRLANLGRYPARILPSTFVFDWHTHLHHDIAPALGKPAPPPDEGQMAATIEWMLAGLEQMNHADMGWVDRPLRLTLTGLAGGSWEISPAGSGYLRVAEAAGLDTACEITGATTDFPAWATTRTAWRDAGLTISGDSDYAARFLDAVNII